MRGHAPPSNSSQRRRGIIFSFITIFPLSYKWILFNDNPFVVDNLKYFSNYIHGRDRSIKNIMMDQSFVSGLGNIYVNEILFSSKVKPNRKVKFLKKNEIKTIIKIIFVFKNLKKFKYLKKGALNTSKKYTWKKRAETILKNNIIFKIKSL